MTEPSLDDLDLSSGIKKKITQHYASLETLSKASPKEVSETVEISIRVARNAVTRARTLLGDAPVTALELLAEFRQKRFLTTGSQSFDEILGGGIATGSITELAGEFSSGKTQLAFQLCINAQLPTENGGLDGKVYFLDTEGTFSVKRVLEIAVANTAGLEPKGFLKNIFVARAFNVDHQIQLINDADNLLKKENVRLLVIDSIASHFRTNFQGKDQLATRQQKLMSHAERLQRYADSYDLAIVTTNQVLASFDGYLAKRGASEPALGYAWGHRPQTRIFLRKQKGTVRTARIIDSPELPEREATFYITAQGISSEGLFDI
ncbi:MAG: DNA repair and recombination protein RadA [Candidatus Hodarchaeales archaeon]|jgi:DNA repair protein RadA